MIRRLASGFTRAHGRLALRSGMAGFVLAACTVAGLQLQAQAQAIAAHNSNAPVSYAADRIELQDRQNRGEAVRGSAACTAAVPQRGSLWRSLTLRRKKV